MSQSHKLGSPIGIGGIRIACGRDLPPQVHIDIREPTEARFQPVSMRIPEPWRRPMRPYNQPYGGFWTSHRLTKGSSEYTQMLDRDFSGIAGTFAAWEVAPQERARLAVISSSEDLQRLLEVARYRGGSEIDFEALARLRFDGVTLAATVEELPELRSWDIPCTCWLRWSFTPAGKLWDAQRTHKRRKMPEPRGDGLYRVRLPWPQRGLWIDIGEPRGEAARVHDAIKTELWAARDRGAASMEELDALVTRNRHASFDATV